MAEKTEFVLGANFGTPYGSGSQLIFSYSAVNGALINLNISYLSAEYDLLWISCERSKLSAESNS
jgi:hypothetical protein